MPAIGDYPVPKFHFAVEWDENSRIGFTEVSGLEAETEVIEYREGHSKKYNKSQQPGLTKYPRVTLKRGYFEGDHDLFKTWKDTYFFQEGNSTGSKFRRTILIKMLNENHEPICTWVLENAWIPKVTFTDLKADANEVAIETMEVAHEGLIIQEAT